MKIIFLFLAIIMASTPGFAKSIDTDFRLNATTFADGVLLKANQPDMGFKLTVVGPEDIRFSKKYSASDPVFLGTNSTEG
ncbi:MAG: hypothetical protein IMF09_12915, partial [Proteobacteria bacterium]|nr:hypothetical protein [Pseudomonadota bacterium]